MTGENWKPCKCPLCGKEFYVPIVEEWAYKIDQHPVCSWGCLRRAEKTGEKPRDVAKMKRDWKPPERWYRIREMRDKGASHREVAKTFGIKETSVGSIIANLNKYERMKEEGETGWLS